MMSEYTQLPPLQTADELQPQQPPEFLQADEWFNVDISKDFLDFTKPQERSFKTLSFNGIAFAPLKGIHALTGQSGHGKTMLFSQLMAAILRGEYGGLRYELADYIQKPTVLYVDTEMELENTIGVKDRVLRMIGRNTLQPCDDFKILMLRETEEAVDRWRKTLKAIYEVKPTVCFVDGLLDLCRDFNDNETCQKLIYRCMSIATHYNISLWCLVHQNPGNTTKLIGHLGSMLERKVTDVFCCIKETNDKTGEIVFHVKQTKARSQDVPSWRFRVLPINGGIPEQIDESTDFDEIEQIREWLRQGAKDITFPATADDLKKLFKKYGNVGSHDRQQRDLKAAQNRRFLVESEWQPGQRFPKYNLNID